MFSYLNGIRPSNRRSAAPPAATPQQPTSSRYYHETVASTPTPAIEFSHPPLTSQSNSHNDASPVSPDPPMLPPITRVSSYHEPDSSDRGNLFNEGVAFGRPQSTRDRLPVEAPVWPSQPIRGSNQQPAIQPKDTSISMNLIRETAPSITSSRKPQPTQSRRKRPIDIAYESMRAYSEPPRRHSFGNTPSNAAFLPQPSREPPPPPPKIPKPFPSQRQAPPPPARAQTQAPTIATQKSHGKAKLNLLNPMSLLARRRSSQAVEEAYSQSQSTPRLPDDFDPRIRGKVVHDFSAPRPSRPASSGEPIQEFNDSAEGKQKRRSPQRTCATNQEDSSPSSVEKEHTPVFKENFDDNVEPWSSDMDSPAKRRSSAFMYQVSLQTSEAPDPSSLPAFARNLPSNLAPESIARQKSTSPPPRLPASLDVLLEAPTPDQTPAKSSPPMSPPKTRSRATSINDPPGSPGSPQRYKSNASRFSFDLAGVGSAAQEKLLEEKHRQKAKQQERQSTLSNHDDEDDDVDANEAYLDLDDMDDDGLEEKIPGINADAEDYDMPVMQRAMENLQFISPNKSSFESVTSPASTGLTSPATPRDSQSHLVGLASKSSPNLLQSQTEHGISLNTRHLRPRSTPDGLTDATFDTPPQREDAVESNLAGLPRRYNSQDDDMYFDDGLIEDFDDTEQQLFDESVFDDETSRVYGLPLRDLKPLPNSLSQVDDPQCQEVESSAYRPLDTSNEDGTVAELRDSIADLNQPVRALSLSQGAGLTQDKLNLHDQLAFAANQAALEGKFNRTYSHSSTHASCDNPPASIRTTTQDNLLESQVRGLPIAHVNDTNEYGFDDDVDMAFTEAEDDDPIIAAANAEALENDDDGFYGQEFGFFAHKPGSTESEYANGGYFGPRALETLHRMNSGRENFLEPSLTPITERSEWSNRNSMVSLAMHGFPLSSRRQSNAQLADLMRVSEGEEMSLEALRKLRHGAWGGSTGSLPSSSNSQNGGSPLTYLPGMVAPFMQPSNSNNSLMNGQNLAGSFHSFSSGGQVSSNDSSHSPAGESPTITISPSLPSLLIQSQPMNPPPPPPPMGPPPPPPADSSPVKRSALNSKPWAPGHSRNSSGAESVSYREENGRWFCEKTRVIEETGEVEVLGRSVIEGGRI